MEATKELVELCGQLSEEVYDVCIEVGDLGYTVTEFKDYVVVSFRGTANARNAGRDINVIPWKGPRGFLTTWGFMRAFKKLRPHVLHNLKDKQKPVIFTGHSLGGALAVLFAEDFGNTELSCITFGCPRIYSRISFWFKSGIKHIRIYLTDDPVPMIPRILFEHAEEGFALNDRDSRNEVVDISDHSVSYYRRFLWQFSG